MFNQCLLLMKDRCAWGWSLTVPNSRMVMRTLNGGFQTTKRVES